MYDKNKKDCPRGFHFCKDKQECVPTQAGVEDKLVLKYERYFFKEGAEMDKKQCKEGYRWCPIQKKCVPKDDVKAQGRGQHRGQGKGPMGKPYKEASDLVDLAFDEGFETFGKVTKAHKKMDAILDGVAPEKIDLGQGSSHQSRPYDHPKKVRTAVDIDECDIDGKPAETGKSVDGDEFDGEYDEGPETPDDKDKESNDINHVPNQNGKAIYQSIRKQLGEWKNLNEDAKEAYRKYFSGMLKKYGVNSPAKLDTAKKKEFFDAVDKGWNAKKETD